MEKTLKINRVGIHDDFFTLGGDSIRVMALQQNLPNLALSTKLIYENTTVEELSNALQKNITKQEKADMAKAYPLTQAQLGIFLECIKREGEKVYNNPVLLSFPQNTDIEKLASSIEKVVKAHPGLSSTVIIDEKGNPFIKYNPEFAKSKVYSIEEMDEEQLDREKASFEQPFVLTKDRLFRFRIIKTLC